jgi:poly(A) polymerase
MPLLMREYSKLSIRPEAARLLTEISRLLAAKNNRAYIVGGFVRDTLLELDTADIDIAVVADALEVARDIAGALHGKYIPLDDVNLVGRVILPDNKRQLDFTTLKGENIEEDLACRDFTIDAMAFELDQNIGSGLDLKNLIDPFQGRQDLENRTLRALNDEIFSADAARLLRAFRIAAELNLDINSATETLIWLNSLLISRVPGERIREELLRLLAFPGAGERLFQMDKLGLLTALIPELSPARGVSQPHAHVFDVFEHSLQTVSALEFVLRESDWEYGNGDALAMVPWSDSLEKHFDREISSGSTGRTILKLTALLHDIAKPQTKFIEDGHARFFGHQEQGADIAAGILERLRFSNREIQLVKLLIKYHLRPTQMSNFGLPTDRAVYRFFRDIGEAGIDVLFLSLADHLAARGPSLDTDGWREHTQITSHVLQKRFEEAGPTSSLKFIDGRDIMKSLGLAAGPVIGELLEALREAQAAGEIKDKSQALKYLQHIYREKEKNIPN